MKKRIKLAMIFGGPSGEYEISLKSAREVIRSLNKKEYDIWPVLIPAKKKWDKKILKNRKID